MGMLYSNIARSTATDDLTDRPIATEVDRHWHRCSNGVDFPSGSEPVTLSVDDDNDEDEDDETKLR
jgi:hypothetical protein